MKTTVRIESEFFLTPKGEEALDSYEKWKSNNGGDSEDIRKRREKLKASGLVNDGAPKIKGGLEQRVINALALDGAVRHLREQYQ